MVIHQKNLILLTFSFLLPFCKSYAASSPITDEPKYTKNTLEELEKIKINAPKLNEEANRKAIVAKSLEITNTTLPKLKPENQIKVIETAFEDPAIKITPKILKKQIDRQDDKGESFLNEILTENSAKDAPIKLSPKVLMDHYHLLENPKEFLNDLLVDYSTSPSDRQELVNNLLESYTNQQLLQNLSDEECALVGKNANPTFVGTTQVIDWLNTAHFKGFFNPTMSYALVNRDSFNEFDTLNQWNLWAEPFGFYTQFRREDDPLKFNMYTAGISVGGEFIFYDRLLLGLGVAYSHSGVTWEEHRSTAELNSLYFGPSLSYVFQHGYLSCTLFGMANFYEMHRSVSLFPDKLKPSKSSLTYQSWDAVGRLEGGLAYEVGGHFFLYPTAKIDYLMVFEQDNTEALDEETELKIGALDGSYLNSKAGLKVTREIFSDELGYLIPSLSAGIVNFTPLSHKSYHYEIDGIDCAKFDEKLKVGSWNQYYVGAGFTIVHKRAILISFDYELTLGADSPLHAGNIRAEWSW
ncbi:MAG: autotransporter outer membrane beta-barrel domain-containing protein [Verrucomicrobia bacterium]|nr:autotransporter outer membrane beta-barrel domain-containing protein [Verrucomicrobiota bacterium]